MKIKVKNTVFGLVPWFDNDLQEKSKLRIGKDYEVEIKLIRNSQFHRKFFAMLNVGHANTSLNMPFDTYRKYMTVKAGFFDRYPTKRGEFIEPKSIAFHKMDEAEFQDVYNRVLDVILLDVGSTREELEKEILSFA